MTDLQAVEARYQKALDAQPSKGEISPEGHVAIIDSVCDVPDLLREVRSLRDLRNRLEALAQHWYASNPGDIWAQRLLSEMGLEPR